MLAHDLTVFINEQEAVEQAGIAGFRVAFVETDYYIDFGFFGGITELSRGIIRDRNSVFHQL